jgi:uncharacterized membrane protein
MLKQERRDAASMPRFNSLALHLTLVPIQVVCFGAVFITDVVYWRSTAIMWADMSAWLLAIGVLLSVYNVAAGLVEFLGVARVRALRAARIQLLGNLTALILSIFNAMVHTRDAYTSVVPLGLILSTLVILILGVVGWNGWTMVYRHGIGLSELPS